MNSIKIFTVSILLTGFLSVSAHAARWIVKNPKVALNVESLRGIESHKVVTFKNQYVILESSERISAEQLVKAFAAESAFEDIKIIVDDPEDKEVAAEKGWHVEKLEYAKLNKSFTGQGIIVAVLDTGVDYRHPDLESKMWKNTAEIPDNEIDDDNNGLVDDYHGYNFNDGLPDPDDTGSHGTHCAGIIAAEKNKESIAQGVAPDVKIMPLVVIGADAQGFLGDAGVAVKYATDNGAKVLSNSWRIYASWGTYMNIEGAKFLEEAIAYAGERGVIFVAAAGNEMKNLDQTNAIDPIYPLSFKGLPNLIGIASSALVGNNEILSSFSNYGVNLIPVAAPGSEIYSTVPFGQWASMSGTSMATPIVAGTLARGLSKGYSMEEAIENLKQTSNKSTYWDDYVSHGRINIKKYLE